MLAAEQQHHKLVRHRHEQHRRRHDNQGHTHYAPMPEIEQFFAPPSQVQRDVPRIQTPHQRHTEHQ
jgi:hypothetical protein